MTTRWTRRSPSKVAATDELAVVLGASRSTVWSSQVSVAAAFVHELLVVSSWSIAPPCLYKSEKGLILWSFFFPKFAIHCGRICSHALSAFFEVQDTLPVACVFSASV